jgi:hypothetical protein
MKLWTIEVNGGVTQHAKCPDAIWSRVCDQAAFRGGINAVYKEHLELPASPMIRTISGMLILENTAYVTKTLAMVRG